MTASYYLGVDGGASRCRVRIRDAAGALAGEAVGGNANVFQNPDAGIATIIDTARQAAASLPAGSLATATAGLGLAGLHSAEATRRAAATAWPFGRTIIRNDAYVACLGAHAGGDGGIVIAGTGSSAYAIVGDREHDLGGFGFDLGDDGSGAVIGRALLRQVALASDGIIPATGLLSSMLAEFPAGRPAMTDWASSAAPRDYALFAPRVFEAAADGDAAGRAIVAEAANGVAGMLRRLKSLGAPRLSLVGGLAGLYPRWLPADIGDLLSPPLADATEGAILMARRAPPEPPQGSR